MQSEASLLRLFDFPAKPGVRLLVLTYWSALCVIHVYSLGSRRLPVNTASESAAPGLLGLFRLLLSASYFAAPFLLVREWLCFEIVLFAAGLLLLYPWWTTRYIALPLRMPRLAYALTALGGMEWWYDKPEGPVAAAAWCLSRQRKPTDESIRRAEKHLVPTRQLRASTVAAHAMLAASRGQRQEARMLFESMLLLDGQTAPVAIWRMCFEWLATDAAARGDWGAVRRYAAHYLAPRVSTLLLLADVADRPPGKRRASIVEVFRSRLPYPPPDLTPILSMKPPPISPTAKRTTINPAGLEGALRATVESAQPHAGEFKILAEQWEGVFGDEQLHQRLAVRGAALGGGDASVSLNQLRQMVQSDLTDAIGIAHDDGKTIPGDSVLLEVARNSCRRRLLSELAERITNIDARRCRDSALPAFEEWKEFLALHRTYSRICAVGDDGNRSIAFYTIGTRLNVFAVWLLEKKKENVIANAIFRFLLLEAERNNTPERSVLRHNARASLENFRRR